MTGVRPLEESDLDSVIALHQRLFPSSTGSGEELSRYLRRIFFQGPFANPDFPSLAFEDNGRIVAVIGSLCRPMLFEGKTIDVVVTHTFMADPDRRSAVAGIRLLREILAGRQQLSLAQGNDASAKLWTAVGGESSPLLALHWLRLLRPVRYVESRLVSRGQPALGLLLRPVHLVLDRLATGMARSPVSHEPPSGVTAREASAHELLSVLNKVSSNRSLAPKYDVDTLSWMLDALRYRKKRGDLRMLLMAHEDEQPFGWVSYQLGTTRIAEVVSVCAPRVEIGRALEYLFWDAHAHGADALVGLADPLLIREYSTKQCYFREDASWFLIHTKDVSLSAALHRGDCFISRMEAEWWVGFDHDAN